MKPIYTILFLILASLSFSQEIQWHDPYNIINNEKLTSMHVETTNELIDLATKDFDSLKKNYIVNDTMCKLFKIRDHVDFCLYIQGYSEIDFTDSEPMSFRAMRQIDADKKFDFLYNSMKAYLSMNVSKQDKKEQIRELALELFESDVLQFCSHSRRMQVRDIYSSVNGFLRS